jgi:serine/threonine protein kinase
MSSKCSNADCKNTFSLFTRSNRCNLCRNEFCSECFVSAPRRFLQLFSDPGLCLKCYSTVAAVPNFASTLPSEEELKSNLTQYASVIEQDPFLFFDNICELGRGAYSTVIKVRDKENYAESALTDCPQLVGSFAMYLHQDRCFILQELMMCSVYQLMQQTPFPESVCLYVVGEVLKGLEHLHRQGKIHRDIKSENIFFDRHNKVKIGDFGALAQLTQETNLRSTLIGSPFWLAPEIAASKPYDTKVDIWSLGVVAYELVEGDPPHYQVESLNELTRRISMGDAPMITKDYPTMKNVVYLCLQKDPNKRLTAEELMKSQVIQYDVEEVEEFLQMEILKFVQNNEVANKVS